MWVQIFGYGLTAFALASSLGMIAMGRRWQAIEAAAYGGARRPVWFWLAAAILLVLWALAAWDFVQTERTLAGWVPIAGVPFVWALKASLLVFNPKGRKVVSEIDTDAGWRKVGYARLPIAVVLAVLTAVSLSESG